VKTSRTSILSPRSFQVIVYQITHASLNFVATYLEQSLTKLKEFEGCVPWMYRDTVGKVTVGVGLMLPDAKAAESLPFLFGTRPATSQEIAAEYTRVDSLPQGRASTFYKSATTQLQLTQQTIDAKLTAVLQNFETELRTHLPHYDTFPDGVKLALLDMTYNLGPSGLFKDFPHLIEAAESGSWAEAAAHCMRRGPSPRPQRMDPRTVPLRRRHHHQERSRLPVEANLARHTSNLECFIRPPAIEPGPGLRYSELLTRKSLRRAFGTGKT
jgi:GH24 family phage-related lysozyme (muramidase)